MVTHIELRNKLSHLHLKGRSFLLSWEGQDLVQWPQLLCLTAHHRTEGKRSPRLLPASFLPPEASSPSVLCRFLIFPINPKSCSLQLLKTLRNPWIAIFRTGRRKESWQEESLGKLHIAIVRRISHCKEDRLLHPRKRNLWGLKQVGL